ncbi:hypothetical protein [Thermogymnomonas acidicola]|uniref:hypothetical protein n=1 Tax=Thermogymnomonas acidicola TaxID=399579 RepID=UPI001665B63A|nr:hypothetical protein [Thermogymnomonas acidicola]
MISPKVSVVIAVVAILIFGGLTYTVAKEASSSTSISISSSGVLSITPELTPDSVYKVNSTTELPVYYVLPGMQYIWLNFTMNSTAPTVYVYDISPLNNTSTSWVNLTYFNKTEYPYNYITISNANGTGIKVSHRLYINESAYGMMKPDTPYVVRIILISSQDKATGLGLILIKPGQA